MASVKKPKVKGKNRLFMGDCFGTQCIAVAKTWPRCWRKAFPVGPRSKRTQETVTPS